MEQENTSVKKGTPSKPGLKNKVLILLLVISLLLNLALIIVVVIAHTSDKQARLVTEAVCHVKANPSPKLDTAIRDANPIQVSAGCVADYLGQVHAVITTVSSVIRDLRSHE